MLKKAVAYMLIGICLLAWPLVLQAAADSHSKGKKERHGSRTMTAPQNQLYQDRCGGCHLAYPPALLPGASWRRILQGQANHYGENLELNPAEQTGLTSYFEANAADRSSAKVARKIMKSLGGSAPLKITEVPYIIHKHEDDDIPRGAFQRKSVGSMANCGACHPGAAAGDFDDDAVRIPAK